MKMHTSNDLKEKEQVKDSSLLQITALSFAYHLQNGKHINALRHVNLQLQHGTILGLVGESSCGKTTLCNILMHSLSYHHGHIYFQQQELNTLPDLKAYYRQVQYVFQDPLSAMPPHLPLQHFACAPLINLCHYRSEHAYHEIQQLMAQVQLPTDSLQRYPHELSLGQLQRLNLIKSLSIKPDLLLCDEITSALDPQSAKLCLRFLQQYQQAGGTVIFITHDLNLALQLCTHFALMFKGTIVEQWAQNEQPRHPYMQQLQQAQAILAKELDLSTWQESKALSCPVKVDLLCPFLLRCPQSQEQCLQQAPTLHQLNNHHQISCHLI